MKSTFKQKAFQATMLLAFMMFLLTGCKKDRGEDSPYYVKFYIDGVKVEFKGENEILGVISYATNVHSLDIKAYDEPADMILQLFSTAPIAARAYSGFTYVSGSLIGCIVGYSPDGFTIYVSETDLPDDPTIEITEINNNIIKGNFHGTIYSPGRPEMLVTDGEFFVKAVSQ